MKITERQLKQLIKEEVAKLKEDLFIPPPSAAEVPSVLSDINNTFDHLSAKLESVADYYASIRDSSNERRARTALNNVRAARQVWRAGMATPGTRSY